jgi:hypothetical protein
MRSFITYVQHSPPYVTLTKYVFIAIPMFSGSRNSLALSGRLDVEIGREKFKIAATKPDVPVSQFPYKTANKFHIFLMMSEKMERFLAYSEHVLRRSTPKFKMVESQTGSTYVFLQTKGSNKFRQRTFKQHRKS